MTVNILRVEKILARHRHRDSEQPDLPLQLSDADAVQLHSTFRHALALAHDLFKEQRRPSTFRLHRGADDFLLHDGRHRGRDDGGERGRLANRRRDTEAVGGVLAAGDDEIQVQAAAQLGHMCDDSVPARTPHDIAAIQKTHEPA